MLVAGTWWILNRHVRNSVAHSALADDKPRDSDIEADALASSLKTTLNKLSDQETFLQALIDADPDGLRVMAFDGTIQMANQAYCRIFGITMEEAVGQRCYASSHGRSEPCAPTLITCPLHEIAVNGSAVKTVQAIRLQDASERHVEIHAAPLTAPDGRLLVVESIRDLASDIRFSHEQKLSAIGELAAGVAHEIRNPLASVRLALQSLIRLGEAGRLQESSLMDYLKLVDSQVDKCIDVTSRLLRLSANQSGQLQIVPVRSAIEETVSLLAFEAEESQIRIDLHLPAKDIAVMVADGDFRLVVLNLVQNAFHAMPTGGGLTVSARADEKWVDIEVADTGIGIKSDVMSRIFQPFFSSRADGVQGTGIGLTICKGIVERSGGAIHAISQPGEGARFIVRLPRAAMN
ncbi:MAG: PAS domain-containing protein [Alphaproteobacteria bacterium]|nr:PAS domain-containing protein [Alphaproteobacteria bacterium]